MKISGLNDLSLEIFERNREKGFWPENPKDRNFGEVIALVHSELSEALEADRKGRICSKVPVAELVPYRYDFKDKFEEKLKDTREDELADAIIRILDYCGAMKIDIESHIYLKLEYNATRGKKHGKLY